MRTKITLACTECKQRNYNTTKDKKTHPDRMETKKYCRFCKTHTLHKETKQFAAWQSGTSVVKGKWLMGDSDKKQKAGFFKGVKQEFGKISWLDKASLMKQSVAVVGISVVMGLIITLLDTAIVRGLIQSN